MGKFPRYVCHKCGSQDIEATLPAWFNVNDPDVFERPPASVDYEADWGYAVCNSCEESGESLEEIAKRIN